jgi:hypothetical protein
VGLDAAERSLLPTWPVGPMSRDREHLIEYVYVETAREQAIRPLVQGPENCLAGTLIEPKKVSRQRIGVDDLLNLLSGRSSNLTASSSAWHW